MIIKIDKKILGINDEEVPNGNGDFITLRQLAKVALASSYVDESDLSGEDKFKRYLLFVKIKDSNEVDLSTEEIVLIKSLIAKANSPLFTGQAWLMLEGKL